MSGTHSHGGHTHRHAAAGFHVHDPESGDALSAVPPPRRIAAGVLEIDTMLGGWEQVTAGYLIEGPAPVLVETGSQTSVPVLLAALDQIGVGPAELAGVAVTHIHLDHAGGVGDVARAFPSATVYVHEKGRGTWPTRHVSSTRRRASTAPCSTPSTAASTRRHPSVSTCSTTGRRFRSAQDAPSWRWTRPVTPSTMSGCTTR